MSKSYQRVAAWALIVGTVIATIGYLASGAGSDPHFTSPSWIPLYSVALAGDIVLLAGLPLVLVANGDRFRKLTAVGTAGLCLALVMLNIGEGVIEGYVKPYLVRHGGIPGGLPGFDQFEIVALVAMLGGMLCLGVAVIRAGVLGWWVGVLFIVAPVLSLAGLPGPLALVADYLTFAALFTIGVKTLRARAGSPARLEDRAASAVGLP